MKCPHCEASLCGQSVGVQTVIDSRPVATANAIRRRRVCPACGTRVTTMERIERVKLPKGAEADEFYVVGTA